MRALIHDIPKVELHVHVEGTFEPGLMLEIAGRNGLPLAFASVEEGRRAYDFGDLGSFLKSYYEGTRLLRREEDFYDLTHAYLQRAHVQNIRHVELFFDPQSHTARGVPLETAITGIHRALLEGEEELGISWRLIPCFLRDLSPDAAMETLEEILVFREWIAAVGLDSAEAGNPPEKFEAVFQRARGEGLLAVAHAGEEGPPDYIRQALDKLRVSRLDHGVRCMEDPELVRRLAAEQVPLTVCPLSNVRLGVFKTLEEHNLKQLLDAGVKVTVHSDDPAYFGGYMEENLLAVQQALHLNREDIYRLAQNSISASFLSEAEKQALQNELDACMEHHAGRP